MKTNLRVAQNTERKEIVDFRLAESLDNEGIIIQAKMRDDSRWCNVADIDKDGIKLMSSLPDWFSGRFATENGKIKLVSL